MKPEIAEKKTYLLHWMYDFIEDDDEPAYQKADVEECDQLLTAFINQVASDPQANDLIWLTSQVEILVKSLNQLNIKHEYQLIETDQREDICALIDLVVADAGHHYEVDITEPWRQW